MPVEIWAYILDIRDAERKRAATIIQAHIKGFLLRVRHFTFVRYLLRYMYKGQGLTMPAANSPARLWASYVYGCSLVPTRSLTLTS